MRRFALVSCGLFLALSACILLWNGPLWYTNEESPIPATFTRVVGISLIVLGALAAFWSAVCLGRALAPLRCASDGSPVGGGGPVLPLCGMLLVLSAIGPLRESRRAAADYEFAQAHPEQIQDWYVELSHRLIGVGRTLAVVGFAAGAIFIATPLFVKPRVWQLRRRLNRRGRKIATAGFLIASVGILIWLGGALLGAMGSLGRGGHSSGAPSYVGFSGIIAGTVIVLFGTGVAVMDKSEPTPPIA
jgi:hypothetical protein